MRHVVLGGCLLAACGHGDKREVASVCDAVRRDPQHAVASVAAKLPGDPVRIARTIEECIAPGGEECERVARIVAAIPSMMPDPPVVPGGDPLQTCRGEPPEMRRCLLPSYGLGHAEECQRIRDQLATARIEIAAPSTRRADCDRPGAIAIVVTPGGVWLGIDDTTRCFGRRQGGAVDRDWLTGELRQVTDLGCRPSVEVAGEPSVAYQDLITAMDVAMQAGFVEISLASPGETVVSFASVDPATAALHCSPGTPKVAVGGAPAAAPRASGREAIAAAPVIVITKTMISVAGKDIVSTADAAMTRGPIAAIERAVPHVASGTAILQADETTSAGILHRVVTTLKHAGYDQVLFAVKTR